MIRTTLAALACCTALSAAQATPFIDVTTLWSARPITALPAGLSVSCTGTAVFESSFGGCRDNITVDQPITTSVSNTIVHTGDLVLTNTTTSTVSGMVQIEFGFSAFNPGGSPVGIGIDNASQSASFVSTSDLDKHGCSVPVPPGTSDFPTFYSADGLSCGLFSPDESFLAPIYSFSLAPGQSLATRSELVQVSDNLTLTYTFDLPEPSAFWLLTPAVLGLGLLRRRG